MAYFNLCLAFGPNIFKFKRSGGQAHALIHCWHLSGSVLPEGNLTSTVFLEELLLLVLAEHEPQTHLRPILTAALETDMNQISREMEGGTLLQEASPPYRSLTVLKQWNSAQATRPVWFNKEVWAELPWKEITLYSPVKTLSVDAMWLKAANGAFHELGTRPKSRPSRDMQILGDKTFHVHQCKWIAEDFYGMLLICWRLWLTIQTHCVRFLKIIP